MTRWCRSFVSLGLVLVLFGASTCAAPATLPTSGISIVQVVRDDHYPPYSFLNEHGASQGGSADLGRLGEVKTGEKGEITVLPWARARESMKSDPDEVIETMFYADKRAALYDFSEPYAEMAVRIVIDKNASAIAGI